METGRLEGRWTLRRTINHLFPNIRRKTEGKCKKSKLRHEIFSEGTDGGIKKLSIRMCDLINLPDDSARVLALLRKIYHRGSTFNGYGWHPSTFLSSQRENFFSELHKILFVFLICLLLWKQLFLL